MSRDFFFLLGNLPLQPRTERIKAMTSAPETTETFRYDLAGDTPRIILITDTRGSRRAVPRLGYVVLPNYRT
jgi:hypothetical protein